jgi:predicted nucleic acid-binding protein
MNVDCLLDTNVLVYAVSQAPSDTVKRERARDVIANRSFGLSAQVLQEFYVTVTRKIPVRLAPEIAMELVMEYRAFPIVPTDDQLIVMAIETALRHRIYYWDAAILAAAETLEVDTLLSEDLARGQPYGRVRVVNPFADVA